MSEFPSLGKQCEEVSCKQLDFLPFCCTGCSGIFCLEHRSFEAHKCSHANNKKDCKSQVAESSSYICHFKDCTSHELIPVGCVHCNYNFCLKHRHQSDHDCAAITNPPNYVSPEERIVQITGCELKKEKKGRGGVRSDSRAAKVALMKLKMKAVGDKSVPQEERIYFDIILPAGSQEKNKPMFFAKEWKVGKVIDKAAAIAGLTNENNLATSRKLCLFHNGTDEMLPPSKSLDELLSEGSIGLFNGSTVILRYQR